MAKRRSALEAATAKATEIKQTAQVDRAGRLLVLARNPEIIARIVATLSPDEALTVAETGHIESPDTIDLLVERSLSGLEDADCNPNYKQQLA